MRPLGIGPGFGESPCALLLELRCPALGEDARRHNEGAGEVRAKEGWKGTNAAVFGLLLLDHGVQRLPAAEGDVLETNGAPRR